MKKITSIAAALCLATAFCGMCTGCANGIKNEVGGQNSESVVVSADTDYKLILCPGYAYGYGSAANTIASGATKLTADQEAQYFVHNAYFVTSAAGTELPTPTGRSGATFKGWRRAEEGELVTYKVVPNLTETLYLYAEWVSEGSGTPDPGPGPVDPTPSGVTVNGKAMEENKTPMAGVDKEYFVKGAKLSAGALTFKSGDNGITISTLDSASTGLTFSSGVVSVVKDGTFDIYLKKVGTKWEVYGSRDTSQDVTSIKGENAVAGNIYLAGNVTDADFSWNNWNASGHKGLKVTGGKLTVKLGAGDNCKFVKYVNGTSDVWQKSLSGAGTHITFANENSNMEVKDAGTYTFTITESGGKLAVTVTNFTAG